MSLGPLDPYNPPWAVPLNPAGFADLVVEGDSVFSVASDATEHVPPAVLGGLAFSRGLPGQLQGVPSPERGAYVRSLLGTDLQTFAHEAGRYTAAVYGGHAADSTGVLTVLMGLKDLTGPGTPGLWVDAHVDTGFKESTRPAQLLDAQQIARAAYARSHAAHENTLGPVTGVRVKVGQAHEHATGDVIFGLPFSKVSGYRTHIVQGSVLWGGKAKSYGAHVALAVVEHGRFYGAAALLVETTRVTDGTDGQHIYEALDVLGPGVVWGLRVPARPPFETHLHEWVAPLWGARYHGHLASDHPMQPSTRGTRYLPPFRAHEHVWVPIASAHMQHVHPATTVEGPVLAGRWVRSFDAQAVLWRILFSPAEPGRPTLRQAHEHVWLSPEFGAHVRDYPAQQLEAYQVIFHVRGLRPRPPPVVPMVRVRAIDVQKASAVVGIEKFGVAVYSVRKNK